MALRYLSFAEVLDLHRRLVEPTGGPAGIRDLGALESAIAQPRASYGGQDLYPSIVEKAAALAFSLMGQEPRRTAKAGLAGERALVGGSLSAPIATRRTPS